MMAKPFSRKGVHKLECPMCDGAVYATVAVLESRGLPSCWCGETLQPTELELALLLGTDCPATTEFEAAKALGMSDREAAKRVETRRREKARIRQLSAIDRL